MPSLPSTSAGEQLNALPLHRHSANLFRLRTNTSSTFDPHSLTSVGNKRFIISSHGQIPYENFDQYVGARRTNVGAVSNSNLTHWFRN